MAHTTIFENKKTEYYMTCRFHQNKNFQVETMNSSPTPQKNSILFLRKDQKIDLFYNHMLQGLEDLIKYTFWTIFEFRTDWDINASVWWTKIKLPVLLLKQNCKE